MPRPRATDPETLIDAAARLFDRKGYRNTTIDNLAQELGISKPTVYQYVKSKAWVLERITASAIARLESDLEEAVATHDEPEEQLRDVIQRFVRQVTDQQPYFRILMGEEAELPARARRRILEATRENVSKLEEILNRCAEAGRLRQDVDAHVAALLITGMLTSVASWYNPAGRLGPDEIALTATRILEGYLRLPAGLGDDVVVRS